MKNSSMQHWVGKYVFVYTTRFQTYFAVLVEISPFGIIVKADETLGFGPDEHFIGWSSIHEISFDKDAQ